MPEKLYPLIELASEVDLSVEELIRDAASGELTLCVIAKEWSGRISDNSDKDADIDVVGVVELQPSDLLNALGADHTPVNRVRIEGGGIVKLDSVHDVMYGVHFVTASERDRFQEKLELNVMQSSNVLPPYLDSSHDHHSDTLDAAVRTWMDLYASGNYRKGSLSHKEQILTSLTKHYPDLSESARERIAKVVNPNKKGGNPKTKRN